MPEEGEAAVGLGDGFRGGGWGKLKDCVVIVCGCGGCHEIGMRVGLLDGVDRGWMRGVDVMKAVAWGFMGGIADK